MMSTPDPRIQKLRKAGVAVLIGLAVVAVPIGVHIIETRDNPELWLSLLGAVFMMVLICLYALETALAPIPERRIPTPVVPSSHPTVVPEETLIHEPSVALQDTTLDEPPAKALTTEMRDTEMDEPEAFIRASSDDAEVVSLVEVEEFPTHPPFSPAQESTISDQVTEQDEPTQNPDAPVMMVPGSALLGIVTGEDDATETDEGADR